jgi:vacuolar-type H+-ATPase subunit D/Vma8
MRFREILGKIVEVRVTFRTVCVDRLERCVCHLFRQNKKLMGSLMRDASFSLASAKFTAGDFGPTVRESAREPTMKVRMGTENAMGVKLPIFEKTQDKLGAP